jgi:hypothetical protein
MTQNFWRPSESLRLMARTMIADEEVTVDDSWVARNGDGSFGVFSGEPIATEAGLALVWREHAGCRQVIWSQSVAGLNDMPRGTKRKIKKPKFVNL